MMTTNCQLNHSWQYWQQQYWHDTDSCNEIISNFQPTSQELVNVMRALKSEVSKIAATGFYKTDALTSWCTESINTLKK